MAFLYYHVRAKLNPRLAAAILVGSELLFPPQPEPLEADFLRRALVSGQTVIEVGARTGGSTRLISDLVGEEGRVIALEPNPYAVRQVINHVKGMKNVSVFNLAAGNRNSTATLWIRHPSDGGASMIASPGLKGISITVRTIDDVVGLVGLDRVDAIVLDVEGSELDVLQGSLKTLRMAKTLLVEVHHFMHPDAERQIEELVNAFGFCMKGRRVEPEVPHITVNLYLKD